MANMIVNPTTPDFFPTSTIEELTAEVQNLKLSMKSKNYALETYREMVKEFEKHLIAAVIQGEIPRGTAVILAEIFDLSLTRTVKWSAAAMIEGTMEIDAFTEEDEAQSFIDGIDIQVIMDADDYDVQRIEITDTFMEESDD